MNLISSRELQDAINDSAQIVDVRTPGEFEDGHIPGSRNIDINSSDFSARMEKLDKEKPVYVYCRSGQRSNRAANELKSMGFKEVYDLEGGINNWTGKIEE